MTNFSLVPKWVVGFVGRVLWQVPRQQPVVQWWVGLSTISDSGFERCCVGFEAEQNFKEAYGLAEGLRPQRVLPANRRTLWSLCRHKLGKFSYVDVLLEVSKLAQLSCSKARSFLEEYGPEGGLSVAPVPLNPSVVFLWAPKPECLNSQQTVATLRPDDQSDAGWKP